MTPSRRLVRGLALGLATGVAGAVVAEVVRPRGGSAPLLDWNRIAEHAHDRIGPGRLSTRELRDAQELYNRLAAEVSDPLLEAVGGLPPGASMPDFEALDRPGWLDLNIGIVRRVMAPLRDVSQLPNSLLADVGRAGLDRYVGLLLGFLAARVLGQFDPQLLGREPVRPALYLVEPNVAGWQAREDLPGDDLRRWLILHEMTHAWQFAAHPWLQSHINELLDRLIALAAATEGQGLAWALVLTRRVPAELDVLFQMQAIMSLIEGYGNLVMNQVGRRLLTGFDALERAHRRRSAQRGPLELLAWRLTGLELKLQQYRVGEAFAQAVCDRHGMAFLNRAWESPDTLPRLDELRHPDRWYARITPSQGRRGGDAVQMTSA